MIELIFATIAVICILFALFLWASARYDEWKHQKYCDMQTLEKASLWDEFMNVHMYMNSIFPILEDVKEYIKCEKKGYKTQSVSEFRESMQNKYLSK